MDDPRKYSLLLLAGSYRRGSLNQALAAGLRMVAPLETEISGFDLRTLPHYDGDLEAAGDPAAVTELKQAVLKADAILLVTPEYNSGIPGVLKNGIDWISRIYPEAPIGGKIAAIFGATPGRSGTKYAQEHLRQVLSRAGAVVMSSPEVLVAGADDVIRDGTVISEELKSQLKAVLDAVVTAIDESAEAQD